LGQKIDFSVFLEVLDPLSVGAGRIDFDLSHLILFGERSLRKALIQFQEHYNSATQHAY
jgi:hypothetical protein